MPPLSLVVCVYKERDLLARLLRETEGCHDDLVVVHDGPDTAGVGEVAARFGGRFFEHARIGSLEGQSPFAWGQARHDWILRLDADEFPSDPMKEWLRRFRQGADPGPNISGFTCIWPIWNGKRAVTERWPGGRIFLFHRQRVRFFGQIEQTPIPDGEYQATPMVLHHQPRRRSHGLRNVLFRKQAYAWRKLIVQGLLGKPTDLPCWRWESAAWDDKWEEVRTRPLRTGVSRLVLGTLRTLRSQWKIEGRLLPGTALSGPLHHFLLCVQFWWRRRKPSRGSESGD